MSNFRLPSRLLSAHSLSLLQIVLVGATLVCQSIVVADESPDGSNSSADGINTSPADATRAQEIAFFEQHIRPLLIEHCYECHAAEEQSGGLRLDSRDAWQAGGDSGPLLTAGDPAHSRLIEAVHYDNLDLQMPPSGKLSSAQIGQLEQWVASGAVDPRLSPASAKSDDGSDVKMDATTNGQAAATRVTGMSVEEGRQFWSFRPLANSPVPSPRDAAWCQTAVDAFVLSQLEAAGLSPAPAADKAALLRRVTLDLIGLPPTPGDMREFLADTSPDAFEKVCERLLASPQYGERWGRHWLDVARYADSNGLDENIAFGQAWRYRDYVIQAFNHDKPFDQFLIEQLAGDLLPTPTVETRTATGFLVLGAKVLAEPDNQKLIMDTVDEQIDTTGKAFLGLTLGCARCHDHKFDPILQSDYYGLAAIFKNTSAFDGKNFGAIKYWNEYRLADEQELQTLQPIEAEIAAKQKAANDFKAQAMGAVGAAATANAAKYFAAASLLAPRPTLPEVTPIAAQYGLHARILHHCRTQLELRRATPAIAHWHQALEQQLPDSAIEQDFAELLQAAETAPAQVVAASTPSAAPDQISQPDQALASARHELGKELKALLPELLTVPVQPEFALDDTTLQAYYALMEVSRKVESSAPDISSVMAVRDGKVQASLPIHIRGSHRNLGEAIPRGFPVALRTSAVPPVFPRHESGRWEMAQWMASSQHPLTARVYVNRLWRWHFGRGLVASTENFGVLGSPPSHPELLDWLARTLIESGWSTKELHRLLLRSSIYQMSTVHPLAEQAEMIDPENQLLWKFNRQRLEAEQLRDALLAVSGRLDACIGGKSVPLRNRQFVFDHTSKDFTTYESLRRAVYLPIIRNNVYTLFEQFDFPDPTMPTGNRQATVVAPQALLMLNDRLVMDCADSLAQRVCSDYSQAAERIDWAYQSAFGRTADPHERQRALAFIEAIQARLVDEQSLDAPQAELQAWSLFCQSLLICNEFMVIE